MKTARKTQRSLRRTFAAPAVIALIGLFGLVAALTGDGVRDLVSWVALAVPILVACWAWRRRG